jgi:hypothetical protein
MRRSLAEPVYPRQAQLSEFWNRFLEIVVGEKIFLKSGFRQRPDPHLVPNLQNAALSQ